MNHVGALSEAQLLAAARGGDAAAFERLVAGYRTALLAHCYRMLGSTHDAEDALQDALLGAWRGLARFEGRSSLKAWLYRVSTNACLRLIARRPRRMLSADHGPPRRQTEDLGEPVIGPVWLSRGSARNRRTSPAAATRPRAACGARASSWPSSPRSSICRARSARC